MRITDDPHYDAAMQPSHRSVAALLLACFAGCVSGGGLNHVPIGTVRGSHRPAAPVEALRAHIAAGEIRIEPASGDDVEVEAEVRLRDDRTAEVAGTELAFADHVIVEQTGGTVVVRSAHSESKDREDWQLRVVIRVPGTVAVQAQLSAGRVEVALPSTRAIGARLAAGEVVLRADRVDGPVLVENGAGSVSLEVRDAGPAGGTIECSTGSIDVALPPTASGSFELSSGVGDVTVAPRYGFAVAREGPRASARGAVGDGDARFRLHTSVGQVSLR